ITKPSSPGQRGQLNTQQNFMCWSISLTPMPDEDLQTNYFLLNNYYSLLTTDKYALTTILKYPYNSQQMSTCLTIPILSHFPHQLETKKAIIKRASMELFTCLPVTDG